MSSQLDGVSSTMEGFNGWLVALEQVASNFHHFINEHWLPAQAILVNLHNATCPSCQKADGMADNGCLSSESERVGGAPPIPVPLPNSRSGEAAPLLGSVPSLISDSSSSSALLYFFAGARQRFQEALGLSVFINEVAGSVLSFFSGNKREVGSDEDLSEASEGSGHGSGIGGVSEGSHSHRG